MTISTTGTGTTGIGEAGTSGVAFGEMTLPGGRQALTLSPRNVSRGHVVILPGIHGQTPHVLSVCQQLAEGGTATVVIGTYGRTTGLDGPAAVAGAVAELDDDEIAAEVGELCASLTQDGPVGVLGFCIGATLGLLTAARSDAVTAVVAYYGVLRHRGPLAGKGPDPIDALGGLRTPVLGHYGTRDPWCENRDVDDLEAVLQGTGGQHAVYRYPGAGHAFAEPGGPGFRVVAAAEAAARTSVFLGHYLG
jgi:carboxymethylenebutenolidase